MGSPGQEHWSGLPFPSSEDLPNQGLSLHLLHWQADPLTPSHQGSATLLNYKSPGSGFLSWLWLFSIWVKTILHTSLPLCPLVTLELSLFSILSFFRAEPIKTGDFFSRKRPWSATYACLGECRPPPPPEHCWCGHQFFSDRRHQDGGFYWGNVPPGPCTGMEEVPWDPVATWALAADRARTFCKGSDVKGWGSLPSLVWCFCSRDVH